MKKINLSLLTAFFAIAFFNLGFAQKGFPLAENIPTSINSAAFIKFDGVDGETMDKEHDKWIDVLSTDWGSTGKSIRAGYVLDPIVIEIPHLLPKSFFKNKIDNAKARIKTNKGTFLITLVEPVLTNGLIGERGIVGERGASKGLIGERGVPVSIEYQKILVQFKDLKGNTKTLFKAVQ